MPTRGTTDTPAKKETGAAEKEVAPKTRRAATPAATPKKEEDGGATNAATGTGIRNTVQKAPLQEKFKKFCNEAEAGLADKINDISERPVQDGDERVPVVFATFGKDGAETKEEDFDNEFNIECIKKVLFLYHTAEEKVKGGKSIIVEVLPPSAADEPHIICFHEE